MSRERNSLVRTITDEEISADLRDAVAVIGALEGYDWEQREGDSLGNQDRELGAKIQFAYGVRWKRDGVDAALDTLKTILFLLDAGKLFHCESCADEAMAYRLEIETGLEPTDEQVDQARNDHYAALAAQIRLRMTPQQPATPAVGPT